jgi:membrane-associated phospholipid phosphatase
LKLSRLLLARLGLALALAARIAHAGPAPGPAETSTASAAPLSGAAAAFSGLPPNLSAPAAAQAPDPLALRPFLAGTLDLIGGYGASPLNLRWNDLYWLAPSAAALGLALCYNKTLYDSLATGPGRSPLLDHSMPTVSALGDGLMEVGLAAMAAKLGPPRLARSSVVAVQAIIVAGVYTTLIKTATWTNRPYDDPSGEHFWDFRQSTQSFPSGHTFSAFAAAEAYGAEYGREWTYPVAALIGFSRVYNQDHWPSDVVAGAVLGIAAGVQARRAALSFGDPNLRFSLEPGQGTPLLVAHARF